MLAPQRPAGVSATNQTEQPFCKKGECMRLAAGGESQTEEYRDYAVGEDLGVGVAIDR